MHLWAESHATTKQLPVYCCLQVHRVDEVSGVTWCADISNTAEQQEQQRRRRRRPRRWQQQQQQWWYACGMTSEAVNYVHPPTAFTQAVLLERAALYHG